MREINTIKLIRKHKYYKEIKCGRCAYAESIDGVNEMVGCTKLNKLMSPYSKCQWGYYKDK